MSHNNSNSLVLYNLFVNRIQAASINLLMEFTSCFILFEKPKNAGSYSLAGNLIEISINEPTSNFFECAVEIQRRNSSDFI